MIQKIENYCSVRCTDVLYLYCHLKEIADHKPLVSILNYRSIIEIIESIDLHLHLHTFHNGISSMLD